MNIEHIIIGGLILIILFLAIKKRKVKVTETSDIDLNVHIVFREHSSLLGIILDKFFDNPKIEILCNIYLKSTINPRKLLKNIPISKEQEANLKRVFGDKYNEIMKWSLGASLLFLIKTEMDIKQIVTEKDRELSLLNREQEVKESFEKINHFIQIMRPYGYITIGEETDEQTEMVRKLEEVSDFIEKYIKCGSSLKK